MPVEHLKEPPLPLPPLIISHHPLLSLAVTLTGIICKDQRGSYVLPVAETKYKDQNHLLGWWPFALPSPPPHPPFPSIFPPHPVQTGLGPAPRNKCSLALQARRELEDKLPNTGWERIETERGMHGGRGRGKKKGRELVVQRWRDSSKGS